jgi:hypothetical protein
VLNFDETRFLRIQSGAVGLVEAIENRTLSAKLWPREGVARLQLPETRGRGGSQKGR